MLMTNDLSVLGVFGMPGGWELVIVLGIALLLFGKRLPEVARNMGRGISQFKDGLNDIEAEVRKETN